MTCKIHIPNWNILVIVSFLLMQVNVYEYNNVVSVKYKLKIVWLNIIFKTPRYCYSMIWNWGGDYSFREYTTRVAHPLGNHILAIEREMERWHGIFLLDNFQDLDFRCHIQTNVQLLPLIKKRFYFVFISYTKTQKGTDKKRTLF